MTGIAAPLPWLIEGPVSVANGLRARAHPCNRPAGDALPGSGRRYRGRRPGPRCAATGRRGPCRLSGRHRCRLDRGDDHTVDAGGAPASAARGRPPIDGTVVRPRLPRMLSGRGGLTRLPTPPALAAPPREPPTPALRPPGPPKPARQSPPTHPLRDHARHGARPPAARPTPSGAPPLPATARGPAGPAQREPRLPATARLVAGPRGC